MLKVSSSWQFAQAVSKHSRAAGLWHRYRILRALRLSGGMGAGELARRLNLSRRTVHYYLKRMEEEGLVRRVGKPRSPSAIYVLTTEGYRIYNWLSQSGVQTAARSGRRVAPTRSRNGNRRVYPKVVVLLLVSHRDNELQMRLSNKVRKVVREVTGKRAPPIAFHHIYEKDGWIHIDARLPRELAEMEDPAVDAVHLASILTSVASVLKAVWPEEVVEELVRRAPRAVIASRELEFKNVVD